MVGVPAAYDFGVHWVAWLSSLITEMGDDRFLWKGRGELCRFNMMGGTQWFREKVIRKYADEGKYRVDIECLGRNRGREITPPGSATVVLPSREHVPVTCPAGRFMG